MENELRSQLEALQAENQRLREELDREKQLATNWAREAFLSDLAGNNRISPEEFRENCLRFGLDMPSDRFAVMAIEVVSEDAFLSGEDTQDNQENLRYSRFLIRNVLEEMEKNRCYVMLVQGRLAAILNLLEPDETALESIALLHFLQRNFSTCN